MNNGLVKTMDTVTSKYFRLSCVTFFTKLQQNEQYTIALIVYFREDMIFSKRKFILKCAL